MSHRKKNKQQKRADRVAISQVRVRSKKQPVEGVPNSNVIDLRSMIAKREVKQVRTEPKKEVQSTVTKQKSKKRAGVFTLFSGTKKKASKKKVTAPSVVHTQQRQRKRKATADKSRKTTAARSLEQVYTETLLSQPALQQKHHAPEVSAEELAFWQEEKKKTVPAPVHKTVSSKEQRRKKKQEKKDRIAQQKKIKHQKKKKKPVEPRQSFWERPLTDHEFDAVKASDLPRFGFSFSTVIKPAIAFALLAVVFIIPASVSAMLHQSSDLEALVTQSAEIAFEHLMNGGEDIQGLDFSSAESEFTQALESFTAANNEIEELNSFVVSVAKYIPGKGKQFDSARHLIVTGSELAAAGEQLSKALAILNTVDVQQVSEQEDAGLTSLLVVVHSALAPAVEHITTASEHLEQVSVDVLPEDKREVVTFAQEALPDIQTMLADGLQLTDTLLAFLGHEEQKQYLVIFQNNHEMRPTGGFIGSLALVDIDQGVVTGIDVPGGGVYDISGQMKEQVISPEPLHLINPHWNLQDANWFPHFPASAEKVQWFYEHSGGDPVDGVVALVPNVIQDLLEITGPLDMTEEYDVVITEENFYEEVQMRAEQKYDVTRESKKIIGDMTPLLFNKLFDSANTPDGLIRILSILKEATAEKDILVYMNDPTLQKQFSKQDWSGEIKETDRDYLGIFHANIGGGKTDDVVEEMVSHHAQISADGSIIDTVTVRRVHKGTKDDELRGVNNNDYIRFYLPEGSELLSAEGFEVPSAELFLEPEAGYTTDKDLESISGAIRENELIDVNTNTEFGKTVIGGWMLTPYGESSIVSITYKLPFTIQVGGFWQDSDRYSLLIQKQPGSFDTLFISDVDLPSNMETVLSYPGDYSGGIQTIIEQDLFVGMVLKAK